MNGTSVQPLSLQRIQAALDFAQAHYDVDGERLISHFESGVYAFSAEGQDGQILVVRGFWQAQLPERQKKDALLAANRWNREKLWPKVTVQVVDGGAVRLRTSLSIDLAAGITDNQLLDQLGIALTQSNDFFDTAKQRFPDAVELLGS